MNGNYIKISRKLLDWEWYKNINTKVLFIHMLLRANWKDGKFEGKTIPRGSFVSSLPQLSLETGLTVREVRTAIEHLKTTGELTVKSSSKNSVFTINNYSLYQTSDTQIDRQTTDERQANDRQTTDHRQASDRQMTTIEEYKEGKKEIREEEKEGKMENKNSKGNESMGEVFMRLLPNYQISELLADKIREWLKYKSERREPYKEQGMKSLLTLIAKHAQQAGDGNIIELIDEAMAAGWKGITWNKLKNGEKQENKRKNQFQNFPQREIDYDALVMQQLTGGTQS